MYSQTFTFEVSEKLKYYVYRLVDPRNGETFYVGRGKNNRVFAHINCALKDYYGENYLSSNTEDVVVSAKYKTIREINCAGLKVIHIILEQYFNLLLDYNNYNVKQPFKLLLIILSYIMV